MAFKVNTQEVNSPLLNAINATKLGGGSTIEITYSLGESLKKSAKGGNAFKSGLSYNDFKVDVSNALRVWEDLLMSAYPKNRKNKSNLVVSFVEVDTEPMFTISARKLEGGLDFQVNSTSIVLNTDKDWVKLRAVKGLRVFNVLVYSVGMLLGIPTAKGVSILNSELLSRNLIAHFNLNISIDGYILNVNSFSNTATFSSIAGGYGGNSTSLPMVTGCLDPNSSNYSSAATVDDGSCIKNVLPSSERTITEDSEWPISTGYTVGVGASTLDITSFTSVTLNSSYNETSLIIYKGADTHMYAYLDTAGNLELFNLSGSKSSSYTEEIYTSPTYLDGDLTDGNPNIISIGRYIIVNNDAGVYIHAIDTDAHQIADNGATEVNCDTNAALGNWNQVILGISSRLREIGTSVGFLDYVNFLEDAKSSYSPNSYASTLAQFDTRVEEYTGVTMSRKLASHKHENGEVVLLFDMYSSAVFSMLGGGSADPSYKRMNNGVLSGAEFSYKYAVQHINSNILISTFEGFTFSTLAYGIYSLSSKAWGVASNSFDVGGVDASINLTSPSDHEKLISQLPVIVGGRLFTDDGYSRYEEIGKGDGAGTTAMSTNTALNSQGYYNVAYSIKHGFIMMRIYSLSPIMLRPDDGGIELHICGGDSTDDAVLAAGGFTPISMTFSESNNYLYTILRDPSTLDKYIGIYDITSNVAGTINASMSMVVDPLNAGASRIITRGDKVIILSKDSEEYVIINNADTFSGVQNFLNNVVGSVKSITSATGFMPAREESSVSYTDDVHIDIGTYSVVNNYELSSFIASPRGILQANDPTSAALTVGSGEWYSSATANDLAGNVLLKVAVTATDTVTLWDREGTELQTYTGNDILYTTDNCVYIAPLSDNKFEVGVRVSSNGEAWYNDRFVEISTVSFTESDAASTAPTNLSLGEATPFSKVDAYTPSAIYPPRFAQVGQDIVPGSFVYQSDILSPKLVGIIINSEIISFRFSNNLPIILYNSEVLSPSGLGRENPPTNSCFTPSYSGALIAAAMNSVDKAEIFIVNVKEDLTSSSITNSMSTEAATELAQLADGRDIARLEFSQNNNWLFVLLRDPNLDLSNSPSQIIRVSLTNATILAEDIEEVDTFYYENAFTGQSLPSSFTQDADEEYDYGDTAIREGNHLAGMFKASDGNIYTLFVNDGSTPPMLGLILNQNNATIAEHAPASIKLSDSNMNLGLYGSSLDMSSSSSSPLHPGTTNPVSAIIPGCTYVLACNYDSEATFNNGTCEYPDDGCACDAPNAYNSCGCYSGEPNYTSIGGENYEPCEYCNDANAFNYVGSPNGTQTSINNDMCTYEGCYSPQNGNACNYINTPIGNYSHNESLCLYPFTGCQCSDEGGLENTVNGNSNTHCVECGDYGVGDTPPITVNTPTTGCGCGDTPTDDYCNCAGDLPTTGCDCDGTLEEGYCTCAGAIASDYCDCDGNLNEGASDGDGGVCNCNGESKVLYYQDLEDDGLGDPEQSAWYCEGMQPEFWVLNNTDTNLICSFDENYTGYQNFNTSTLVLGDTDVNGECGGPAYIDGCGNISTDSLNTSGVTSEGCCPGYVVDCDLGTCVLEEDATQFQSNLEGCSCGLVMSVIPGCDECVAPEDAAVSGQCGGCPSNNFPEGACNCSGSVIDECGVCNGANASCTGCTDPIAVNYDATAIVEGPCTYLTLAEVLEYSITVDTSAEVLTDFQQPYALFTTEESLDFSNLSTGHSIVTIDDVDYYQDIANATSKCQVLSLDNPILKCVNPAANAEIEFTTTLGTNLNSISDPGNTNYSELNVVPGTVASYIPTYYFRLEPELEAELENDSVTALFGDLWGSIEKITSYAGDISTVDLNLIGVLEGGEDGVCTNTDLGSPESLPIYFVYAVTPKFDVNTSSYAEFELDFSYFIPTVLPCGGESPTPICCESSGVQNPGEFYTADGYVIATNECEVCGGSCTPIDTTAVEVCCDPEALNAVEEFDELLHICKPDNCTYPAEEITGIKIRVTVHTEGLDSLEDLKWVLYSKNGGVVHQSALLNIGQAVDGVLIKEIPLSSYTNCMWFLPIGFEYKDIWSSVKLEVLGQVVSNAAGTSHIALHSLIYGASPTPGGSVKINIGNSDCDLGCNDGFLQTEYCESHIREDYTEFTDVLLQVNTAGGGDDAFSSTSIEVINVSTGDTLSVLDTLTPSSEYLKTFRIITDTKIGIKVVNPGEGRLVYKLFSEFGDLITLKEV